MSRTSVKRPFAAEASSGFPNAIPQCSPHRIQFLQSPPSKRKCTPSGQPTPEEHKLSDHFIAEPTNIGEQIEENVMKRKRTKDGEAGEELFTMDQVRRIVEDTVQQREAALRREYDRKLNTLLQEQFDNFTRFSQDYISRQLRRSSADYIS